MEGHFTEQDVKITVDFINFITKNLVTKNLTADECIKYVSLLGYMQKKIVPLMNDNVLEVVEHKEGDK